MNIKNMRKNSGMTQKKLANELQIAQSTVSMWETGENAPRTMMLPKIAKVLDCTVDELLKEDPGEEGNNESSKNY